MVGASPTERWSVGGGPPGPGGIATLAPCNSCSQRAVAPPRDPRAPSTTDSIGGAHSVPTARASSTEPRSATRNWSSCEWRTTALRQRGPPVPCVRNGPCASCGTSSAPGCRAVGAASVPRPNCGGSRPVRVSTGVTSWRSAGGVAGTIFCRPSCCGRSGRHRSPWPDRLLPPRRVRLGARPDLLPGRRRGVGARASRGRCGYANACTRWCSSGWRASAGSSSCSIR